MEKKHEALCPCSGNQYNRAKGEMVILVRRLSFNITLDLPYCIWGTNFLNANSFASALLPYMPPGVTVTTIRNKEILIFRYTQGAKIDDIILFAPPNNTVSYMEILSNLNTIYLRSELVYFNFNAMLNAPLLTNTQLNNIKSQPLFLLQNDGMTERSTEIIIPGARTQINNSQDNIVEISLSSQPVKPKTVWVHKFAYLLLGFGATEVMFYWDVVISEKIDVNSERVNIGNSETQKTTCS